MSRNLQSAIDSYAEKSTFGRAIYKPFFKFLISRGVGDRISYGLTVLLGALLSAFAIIAAIAFWMYLYSNF